jgi:hypothetical protein
VLNNSFDKATDLVQEQFAEKFTETPVIYRNVIETNFPSLTAVHG